MPPARGTSSLAPHPKQEVVHWAVTTGRRWRRRAHGAADRHRARPAPHPAGAARLVTLAPAGRENLREMDVLGDEFEARLLAGLGEGERASLVRALRHIQGNLSRWE